MYKKKTKLRSLRNYDLRTVRAETEKINTLLTYISSKNITESNELIYAGAKLVCWKYAISLKTTNINSKHGWEM